MKLGLGELFSDLLIQPNGIQTFLRVACDINSESSQNFNQHGLQEWSNLIHNFYIKYRAKHIKYIILQVKLISFVTSVFTFFFFENWFLFVISFL